MLQNGEISVILEQKHSILFPQTNGSGGTSAVLQRTVSVIRSSPVAAFLTIAILLRLISVMQLRERIMKRLYLMFALGAMALCSCTKGSVTIELETPEGPDVVDPAPEAPSQGFKLTFQMEGIHKLEIECVDGYPLDSEGNSIITFTENLEPGKEYTIGTVPCNVYGGYRLSIFKDGKVAHYFGVHQVIEEGMFISPLDLDESELEFDDPDAPLVEEERPELDKKTKELLRKYKNAPTDENYQALYDQMGVRYDKVVARKKAKLRELEREAHHQSLIDEMQGIVDEMVNNREERLWQRFLSLIDSRKDDDPSDEWCVLKGAWEENAYIGYAPVTNAEYKAYKADYSYAGGQDRYPVVNISYSEAVDYCNWLSARDLKHSYRLPSEYEWILAAGHMPKDVNMNANRIEPGLTSVDAYASSVGNCGGIDFWGNCWEWTSTQTADGKYLIKGGAWDSSRDECRSEYSDASRDGSKGYANVGFRVVRVD